MSTQVETMEFILDKIQSEDRFTVRAMFGEYALYCDGKVVALICDNQLYVKIMAQSEALEKICEKDSPYRGAKMHYLIEESQLHSIGNLSEILIQMSNVLKVPKKKVKKKL